MYRRITVLTLCIFCSIDNAIAQTNFVIEGTAESKFEGAEVHLFSPDTSFEGEKLPVQQGRFRLTGIIGEQFVYAGISISKDGEVLLNDNFLLGAGTIKVHLKDSTGRAIATYKNLPFLDQKRTYDSLILPINDSIIYYASGARKFDKSYNKEVLDSTIRRLKVFRTHRILTLIEANPASFMSLYIFSKEILTQHIGNLPLNRISDIYTKFSDSLKQSVLGRKTAADVELKQSLSIGRPAKDFEFTTNAGAKYDLSSFRGKNPVLLCFWASWCGPCIRSLPIVEQISDTYGPQGLQLISVSIDKDVEKWQQALKRYGLPCLQTCDLPQFISVQGLNRQYDLNAIPQYFLIDPEGRIMYHNLQAKDTDSLSILINTLEGMF